MKVFHRNQNIEICFLLFIFSVIMQEIGTQMSLVDINIMDKILSEQDRIIWESMGLTPDVQSMENATYLTKVCTFVNKDSIICQCAISKYEFFPSL